MNKVDFEQTLSDNIKSLERHKQPERDLWPGIELALVGGVEQGNKVKKSAGLYVLAASVLVVGLLSWLSLTSTSEPLNGTALIAALSEQHQQQKQALLVQFKDQPALTQNWQQQLSELDSAAQAIKVALKNEPNNMALFKLLQNVYQQQISLIERVHSPKWLQI